MNPLIRPRWLLLMACLLTLVIGPPVQTQPSPNEIESARGTFPIPPVVGMRGETFVVTLQRQTVVDYRGIEHFDLIATPAGRLTLAGDSDLPLIRTLNGLNGQRVRLTLEPMALERLDR